MTEVVNQEFIRRRTTEVSIRDGTLVRLRPVIPEDKTALRAGFERLSPESRYRRFMAPVAELTEDQLAYLTEIDYHHHFAWLALGLDQPGLPGLGVSRYVRDPVEPEVAEAAVTVIDDYQGRGLGTLLLEALGAVALENGVRRFRGYALSDNRRLRDLLAGIGATVRHDSPGIDRVEIDLPARAEELRGSSLYEVLRVVARGDGPVFLGPERLSPEPRR